MAAVAMTAATVATQPPAGSSTAPAARAPQPQPILPIAVSVLTDKPETYSAGMVSLTAAVDQRFGATAFSIVQGRGGERGAGRA